MTHCWATFQPNTCRAKESYFDHIAIDEGRKNSNRHLKDFNAMFNWAFENDLIDRNPVKKIPKKGEDQPKRYVPPIEDVNRVLLAADPEEQDILTTIYKVGARLSEVRPFTFHALRHRIAATLEDSGEATIGMMQGFLGHKRKATTEDYLNESGHGK